MSNARGHETPDGTDVSVSRATIFDAFGNSIRDIPAVANTTARAQLVSDLTTAGQGPSDTAPLYVYRADAPGLHRIEYTEDGTVWVPASGALRFASKAAADSWATSNGGLLTAGDSCWVGAVEYLWFGSVWGLRGPMLARAESTTAQSGIAGSGVDLTGMSVTVDVPATSILRFQSLVSTFASTTDVSIAIRLVEGATLIAEWVLPANSSVANTTVAHTMFAEVTGVTAGSHTYKLQIVRIAGTGTITSNPSATSKNSISVDRVG